MAVSIILGDEIHANTRRTRITYRGTIEGQEVAIKCYRKPVFGLVHWLRAQRRGAHIRNTGASFPPIVYSGWLAQKHCFCFATRYLAGFKPLKQRLDAKDLEEGDRDRLIQLFGELMADLHVKGVEQPDGNLTNFLVNPQGVFAVVDEDDVNVFPGPLPGEPALENLANVGARFAERKDLYRLWEAYLQASRKQGREKLSLERFETSVAQWKHRLQMKKQNRTAKKAVRVR